MQSVRLKSATQSQIELVEHALRLVTGISRSSWDKIPRRLHPSFATYMGKDAWSGEPDPFSLTEAALLILRDAILRAGEFADED